jgi:hypothetical protein
MDHRTIKGKMVPALSLGILDAGARAISQSLREYPGYEPRNTKSPELRFRALLSGGGARRVELART